MNIGMIQWFTYGAAGVIAGMAGTINTALKRTCNPFDAIGIELAIIAAVVLGGVKITGGKGSVLGTVLGVFMFTIINNSLIMVGVSTFWQRAVIGLLIIFSTAITALQDKRSRPGLSKPRRKGGVDVAGIRNVFIGRDRARAGFDGDITKLLAILGMVLLSTAIFMPKVFTRSQFHLDGLSVPGIRPDGHGHGAVHAHRRQRPVRRQRGQLHGDFDRYADHALVPADASGSSVVLTLLLAIVVGLCLGALMGALNGFLIAKVGIPSILTTLGTGQLFNGLGIAITEGTTLTGFPAILNRIGNGTAFGLTLPSDHLRSGDADCGVHRPAVEVRVPPLHDGHQSGRGLVFGD